MEAQKVKTIVLDALEKYWLKTKKMVVDNLTSTSTNLPLSANQGKVLKELIDSLNCQIYPVGSIYMSVNPTNPSVYFGGTWISWGSGRVPVGINTGDTNFNAVEKTGGSASHTHVSPQHAHTINSHSHTMAHTHTINSHAHTTGDCTLTIEQIPSHNHTTHVGYSAESTHENLWLLGFGKGGLRTFNTYYQGGGQAHNHGSTGGSGALTSNDSSSANTGGTTLTTNNNAASNTGSANSLPPYVVCYMWKRTA